MTSSSSPFHFGGPLGLGALVAVVGAAGAFVYSSSAPDADPAPSQAVEISETLSKTEPDAKPTSAQTGDAAPEDAMDTEAATPVKIDPPAPKPDARPIRPAETPKISTTEPSRTIQAVPAQAKGAEIVYIVRIKGSEEIDQAARLFRKDPETAQRAFEKYIKTAPALQDFKLVGGSYSGEIRLSYSLPPGQKADRPAVDKIKDIIMSVDGVSYADPDFVAHPGKE